MKLENSISCFKEDLLDIYGVSLSRGDLVILKDLVEEEVSMGGKWDDFNALFF